MLSKTLLPLVLALGLVGTSWAASPVLLATMGNKVSLSLGGKPLTLSVGQQRDGIKLISVGEDSAVLEVEGKRQSVRLGQEFYAGGSQAEQAQTNSFTVFDVGGGHFMAQISLGGGGVRGLIDTGASLLSLSGNQAKAMGLRFERNQPIMLRTAQGVQNGWRTKVPSLRIEGVQLYNVDAVVTDGAYPEVALIGMSVLGQFHMQNDGQRMTLKKKY
ncbi:hypothetical protein GCM10007907_27080 [Chitinimonas prasina]|uniref:TIGR02281 family clan AA aspartic protease n=1 Tax=Chitinimonas prasina TaxID=1434937 RepID=A0ABQ5YHJ5_9NEIS|nr:TIGR02281 family clan AA aspartic protease [Chitinimonas prasina]GLR13918.1 hypothetical protein GCM10007907_27080 [Chitinimonas prasina]